ncbi:uncharacterized protein PgNI_02562 [Pyricularia grisea]|uniref:Bola-like protein n=1 Tax=Pyricularia grisea TaxID=148305 RepID=A0A6P8BII0_PYRGI|nr:uncharacterized protein PgNI_02562 [Pyricularia grisea]TLD16588.1 hypothetical protein PgNI_02562 [Pyricularia grisea]
MIPRTLRAARAIRFGSRAAPRTANVTVQPCRTLSQASSITLPARRLRTPCALQPHVVASYSTASQPDATRPPSQQANSAPEKPDYLNEAETEIWNRLMAEFEPVELVVQDISGGCGSMYGIEISSEKFRGSGMLKQQRMVNKVLADLMKEWHGVQLRTRVP